MKKKIIALVLTLLSALAVFAACGKGKTLESVEVTAQPDKSLYKIDEAFVPTGARLTATYTDKSTKVIEVTEEMCSEVDTSTAGSKQVTVSYTEKEVTKTATMTVTVVGAEISGQSIEVKGADKNMLTVKFKLTQELELDAWDVADGTQEEQWAEITALYRDVATGRRRAVCRRREKNRLRRVRRLLRTDRKRRKNSADKDGGRKPRHQKQGLVGLAQHFGHGALGAKRSR